MCITRFLPLLLLPVIFFGCSESEPESFEAQIQKLHEQNEYEEALAELREADTASEDVRHLLIQTHLAYANYLTHEADHLAMGDRMANALRHFRRVLELDEENSQARTHIDLIEGIYEQMGRDIPQGVAD